MSQKSSPDFKFRWLVFRSTAKTFVFILLWLSFMGGLTFWMFVLWPRQMARDIAGTQEKQRSATVMAVSPRQITKSNATNVLPPTALISLHMAAGETEANTTAAVHIGQRVSVTYRVGKSGKIYVDSIEPVSIRPRENQ